MAAAMSREPPGPPEGEAPGAAAAAGGEEGEGRARGGAEGGGCYLALCARPVHFEKANPVNCVFFDEANKQVGAAAGRGCGAGPVGSARPGAASRLGFGSLPGFGFLPAGHEPGCSPLGAVIVLEAIDFFLFLFLFFFSFTDLLGWISPALLSLS